ncbi:Bifunctional 3-dehydroquinate dehydratase/shikimate dehydrogenase isoform 1 [Hibiscus syriacus]|uniref:Bifunctional 3-dehydroquinate dehydratase/shikimate dehydrogenase isoform 1 n=1 Tax=Hibiscus syriacus TaxID=106335 RepID=A0A6A3A3Y2_HIBSY|nr:Bifunctional 3-dehydroquinate dehydratase/shikimate dehydrogenase isoform 1 [Hibiscus syriacus]
MPHKDSITWNAISSYSQLGLHKDALSLFHLMRFANAKPDHFTFTSTLNACSGFGSFRNGTKAHALIITFGYQYYLPVNNSLVDMYGKYLDPGSARKVFQEIGQSLRNDVTWCSLLFAYVNSGLLNLVSWNAMIDGYVKMGNTFEAVNVFQRIPEKNVISWTSMVAGYARNGEGEQALKLFVQMVRSSVCPDDFTFGAILHACSSLAVLGFGKMVHGCVIRYGFQDLVSWNAMLFGFGMHGLATQALQVYDDMVAHGMKPDKVSFIGLLMICSHTGLINKGRLFFALMGSVYGLTYEIDHVACTVDMLGRGGYFAEAKELASKYLEKDTAEAKSSSHEALLGAYSIHGDVEMGVSIGDEFQYSLDSKKYV